MTAARRGNVEAVRLLLNTGANPAVSGERGGNLIPVAFSTGNDKLCRLLTEAGVVWKKPADLGPMQSLLRTLIDPKRMREYLDLGGNPNETVALRNNKLSLLTSTDSRLWIACRQGCDCRDESRYGGHEYAGTAALL